jgi:hypothetical protein
MFTKIVWFVDENENQSRTYTRQLRRILPTSVKVERLFPPYPEKKDYVSLVNNPETVCLILDQRLRDSNIATYTGIELAQYIRAINSKLPIYILTNYEDIRDEFTSGEWSVENVIPKDIFNNDSELSIFKARLIRRLDVYEDLLDARSQRFHHLLRQRVNNELTEEEEAEFNELQLDRFAITEVNDFSKSHDLNRLISTNRELIDILTQIKAGRATDE